MAIPIVPGALTPNEIMTAWQAGPQRLRFSPLVPWVGASYVGAVRGPLGHIPLVPTGGVTVENAAAMVQAGAIAVGLSTSLFPRALVTAQNWGAIAQISADLVHRLRKVMPAAPT
jgi:2-dehydro-3-deoxyphosphogluconate aldolase/(4S)-4-hydroxy-2-oxoglutarate aldolase